MMNKVLVTGGAGFIGRALASRLSRDGAEVVIADNLHPQIHENSMPPADLPADVTFVPFDVTVPGAWAALLNWSRPDVVVHLAAETGTGQSLTEANRHASVNVLGTALLTDALSQCNHKPRRILLSSSRAVYGDGAWHDGDGQLFYPGSRTPEQLKRQQWDHLTKDGVAGTPVPHRAGSTQPHPISVYGATKLTQEHMLAAWCTAFSCDLTILRMQNVYGPGQALGNPYTGVLSLFARRSLQRQGIDVYEDGHIIRDFVFIDDVAAAMQQAIASDIKGISTFDIGSGQAVSIAEVAKALAQRCEAPEPQFTGAFRHGDVRAASCSIEAATKAFGYSPKVQIAEGLGHLVRWVAAETGARA